MKIIPAIDILNGKCVRLYKGKYEEVKVYHDSPLKQAQIFEHLGIKRLHIVDLDGAKVGEPVNKGIIKDICASTNLVVEAGGGIRNMKTVEAYIKLGVNKVILSSALAKNPGIAKEIISEFGEESFIAGIDFKNNKFAVSGWLETTEQTPLDFATYLKNEMGVKEYIFTDISKDGTLEGPNEEFYKEATAILSSGVIASGGIGSDDDIEKLSKINGLSGVIVGKAYYENRVDLKKWTN